jgi:hypothetical protein
MRDAEHGCIMRVLARMVEERAERLERPRGWYNHDGLCAAVARAAIVAVAIQWVIVPKP